MWLILFFQVVANRSSMRTLLALLFTLILLVTMLQADAVNEGNEQRMKAKRQLLSETDSGRKIDAGGSDTLGNIPTNKGSENTNTADSDSRSKQGTDTTDYGNDANLTIVTRTMAMIPETLRVTTYS